MEFEYKYGGETFVYWVVGKSSMLIGLSSGEGESEKLERILPLSESAGIVAMISRIAELESENAELKTKVLTNAPG